jgi:hypothetical protein
VVTSLNETPRILLNSVEIAWPGGKTQSLDGVKVDRILRVHEPE